MVGRMFWVQFDMCQNGVQIDVKKCGKKKSNQIKRYQTAQLTKLQG
jgi:hypothetical protein